MAGGKTVPSVKKTPSHKLGLKKQEVAKGGATVVGRQTGVPVASDGAGKNMRAKALDSAGIKAGKQPHVASKVNSGKDSPIGKVRPKLSGGPKPGQTKGVDFEIHDRHPTGKDYGWSV